MIIRILLLSLLFFLPTPLLALDFTLHKLEGRNAGPTLLVVGGIQGDEPGGFNAAALLATRYQIERGSLWVVPNLNFPSIIKRSRGLYGDMNRKFAVLPETDPEYHQVVRIKSIITDPQVDLVFNLHDGSGFYRPTYIDQLHNEDRWGQSCIIDQGKLVDQRFGNLDAMAKTTVRRVNSRILDPQHRFRLKNTRTATNDPEQQKSLTYFAVRNNKPAFAIEASKNFSTPLRVYYHLLAMEAYMQQAGLEYSRNFELTPEGIAEVLENDVMLSLADGRITLQLNDLRETLNYFPLPKNGHIPFSSNNPLVALVPHQNQFRIHYGNNRLSYLKPQYFEYDDRRQEIQMVIDGHLQRIPFGATVPVAESFLVTKEPGYRVNVIGYIHPSQTDESDLLVSKGQIIEDFSIDNSGKIYRVEVYRKNRFSGMVLVDFRAAEKTMDPLVAGTTFSAQGTQQDN